MTTIISCCFPSNPPKASQPVQYGACQDFDDAYYENVRRERDALFYTPPPQAASSPTQSIGQRITSYSEGPPSQSMSPELSPVLPAVVQSQTEMTPRAVPIKIDDLPVAIQPIEETAPPTVEKTAAIAKQFRLTVEDIIAFRHLTDEELRKEYDEFFSQVAPPRTVTFWSFR